MFWNHNVPRFPYEVISFQVFPSVTFIYKLKVGEEEGQGEDVKEVEVFEEEEHWVDGGAARKYFPHVWERKVSVYAQS